MKAASQPGSKRRHSGCPEEAAFLDLLRTTDLLSRGPAQVLRSEDLSATQYNVLRILRGAGERGLCRSEVRERLIAQVPDVTRLLDRLEETKLIERSRDSVDRRLVNTRITSEGLDLLRRLDQPVLDFHKTQLGHLSKDNLRTLIELLTSARETK